MLISEIINRASLKGNYPLSNMESLLQQVTSSAFMSMLDGFSGYNQISVIEEDKHKTAFTTPWVTYAYNCMPFGLKNVGATFQRAVDQAFQDLIGNTIVDYQDDLTVYSKLKELHFKHLQEVFERCNNY